MEIWFYHLTREPLERTLPTLRRALLESTAIFQLLLETGTTTVPKTIDLKKHSFPDIHCKNTGTLEQSRKSLILKGEILFRYGTNN